MVSSRNRAWQSTEYRALVDILPSRRSRPGRAAPPGGFDWSRLLTLAEQHVVAPLVFHRFSELEGTLQSSAPGQVKERLRYISRISVARALVLSAALAEIHDAIRGSGRRALLLKGALTGPALYERSDLRPMVDLDLLIRERDHEELELVVGRLGFRRISAGRRKLTGEELFERTYLREEDRVILELHHGLGHGSRYRVDYDGIWSRALPAAHLGCQEPEGAETMSAEDNLLHCCLHRANDVFAFADLRGLLDFCEMICQWPLSWPTVLERARAWGSRRLCI